MLQAQIPQLEEKQTPQLMVVSMKVSVRRN